MCGICRVTTLVPDSTGLEGPDGFITIMFGPGASTPGRSVEVLHRGGPEAGAEALGGGRAQTFLVLYAIQFVSTVNLGLVLVLEAIVFQRSGLAVGELRMFSYRV